MNTHRPAKMTIKVERAPKFYELLVKSVQTWVWFGPTHEAPHLD
jgi:hypothetical protein